jgi:hypothetical protein
MLYFWLSIGKASIKKASVQIYLYLQFTKEI